MPEITCGLWGTAAAVPNGPNGRLGRGQSGGGRAGGGGGRGNPSGCSGAGGSRRVCGGLGWAHREARPPKVTLAKARRSDLGGGVRWKGEGISRRAFHLRWSKSGGAGAEPARVQSGLQVSETESDLRSSSRGRLRNAWSGELKGRELLLLLLLCRVALGGGPVPFGACHASSGGVTTGGRRRSRASVDRLHLWPSAPGSEGRASDGRQALGSQPSALVAATAAEPPSDHFGQARRTCKARPGPAGRASPPHTPREK